jgi:hypothetical protein
MKLLFNIEDKEISSDEIKEHLGYVDADLSFNNLLPDIITSTNDIKKIIGKEVYDLIHEHYTEGLNEGSFQYDFTEYTDNILRATRYPILVKAYSLYAPTNDLSHTNDGRTVRGAENTKAPWQWQIDEDNKAQEKRYYRALDDLIALLDESKPEDYAELTEEEKSATLYYKWTNSEAYKLEKSLFINTVDEFNKIFHIESRLLLMKLSNGLSECERKEILPRIGKEKFDALKENAPTEPIDIELMVLIKEACAFYALAWAIPRMSVTIFPEGVLQYQVSDRITSQAKKPPLLNEHEFSRQAFAETVKYRLLDIEKLLEPAPEPIVQTTEVLQPVTTTDKHFSAT